MIEKPLNVNKKLTINILIYKFSSEEDTKLQPFVISIIPSKVPFNVLLDILNTIDSLSVTILNMELCSNILFTTENTVTNPPMDKQVLIEFSILFFNTLPIFILEFDKLLTYTLSLYLFLEGRINPIIKHEIKFDSKSIYPIAELLNIDIPTEPNINSGLELDAIFNNLPKVEVSISPFSYRSQAYFAPRGYPQRILIMSTKLQFLGSLRGEHNTPPKNLE